MRRLISNNEQPLDLTRSAWSSTTSMTLEFTSSHLCSQGSHSFLLLTKRRETWEIQLLWKVFIWSSWTWFESSYSISSYSKSNLRLCSNYNGQLFVPKREGIRYSTKTYPICDFPLKRSARRSFAPLQKSLWNHLSYVWTKALPGMVFVPAQKVSGI